MGLSNLQRGLQAKEKVNGDVEYIAAFVYLEEIIILLWHQKNRSKVFGLSGSQGVLFKVVLGHVSCVRSPEPLRM